MTAWNMILSQWPYWLEGVFTTLSFVVAGLFFGFILALILTALRFAPFSALRLLSRGYSAFIRGTPFLVQLTFIYFGLPSLDFVQNSFLWNDYTSSPEFLGALALALNSAAYTSALLVSSIRSIPSAYEESALSFGMSKSAVFFRLKLPVALYRTFYLYSNECVAVLHATALLSAITITDITGIAQEIGASSYAIEQAFIVAGAIYLIIGLCIGLLFRFVGKLLKVELYYE